MNTFNLSRVDTLKQLEISALTTESKAESLMEILYRFNQCTIGLSNFAGTTPWECHPDDEYIQVIRGCLKIEIQHDTAVSMKSLAPGDVFVVTKKIWHRQMSDEGVQLLFITSSNGNKSVENIV